MRKAHPNKERIAYERTKMSELPIAERITSFHEEVSLGYTREEAMAEARRCLDCPTPGCVEGCPVGIHIPSFIKLIEKGEMLEAVGIIRETSSLPAVCGRVCPQEKQCESQCIYTLSLKKQAVSIGNLERYVADYERMHRAKNAAPKASSQPKLGRIAVVGSGPAGLSFATDMAKWGYEVTVYEALSQLGGVLRYGIPEFCLPNSIIEDELDKMRELGFTDCKEDTWYFCKILKELDEISFNISIQKDGTKFKIDVLDEDYLQPYNYQNMLKRDPKFLYGLITHVQVQGWMKYLQDNGVISGYIANDYI